MNQSVHLEMSGPRERRVALLALKRLLSGVTAQMSFEVDSTGEGLAA